MSLWRTLTNNSGRLYRFNARGFWAIDLDTKDPSIPNMPLLPAQASGTSESPSVSASASPSISPSLSPSLSPSGSPSISPSQSFSVSTSLSSSRSPSLSPSASASDSPSLSPSASLSPSVSPSVSSSGSTSLSPSASLSSSISPSVSESLSPSASESESPSLSPSESESPSVSPSSSVVSAITMTLLIPSEIQGNNNYILEYAYNAQETLRLLHNVRGQDARDGIITMTDFNRWKKEYFRPRSGAVAKVVVAIVHELVIGGLGPEEIFALKQLYLTSGTYPIDLDEDIV